MGKLFVSILQNPVNPGLNFFCCKIDPPKDGFAAVNNLLPRGGGSASTVCFCQPSNSNATNDEERCEDEKCSC